MDTKLLIDAIVRQTTVLIAQLSTAAGIRAPLAHVADQVFLALAQEIERQGVGRKVVADMFGLALRSYQKRTRRLSESLSVRGRTLWEAVYEYLRAQASVRRKQLDERFGRDPADQVGAVINDLVASGLIYVTGRGAGAVYRALSSEEQRAAADVEALEVLADLAWLEIARRRTLRLSELRASLGASLELTRQALANLVADGLVRYDANDGDPELRSENFVVPVDSNRGWEASVYDHFSTVCAAIAAKVSLGVGARKGETVGGATFNFDVYKGHPYEQRVLSLLARMRAEIDALWEEVAAYNREHLVADDQKTQVSFYFGQNVQDAGSHREPLDANADSEKMEHEG